MLRMIYNLPSAKLEPAEETKTFGVEYVKLLKEKRDLKHAKEKAHCIFHKQWIGINALTAESDEMVKQYMVSSSYRNEDVRNAIGLEEEISRYDALLAERKDLVRQLQLMQADDKELDRQIRLCRLKFLERHRKPRVPIKQARSLISEEERQIQRYNRAQIELRELRNQIELLRTEFSKKEDELFTLVEDVNTLETKILFESKQITDTLRQIDEKNRCMSTLKESLRNAKERYMAETHLLRITKAATKIVELKNRRIGSTRQLNQYMVKDFEIRDELLQKNRQLLENIRSAFAEDLREAKEARERSREMCRQSATFPSLPRRPEGHRISSSIILGRQDRRLRFPPVTSSAEVIPPPHLLQSGAMVPKTYPEGFHAGKWSRQSLDTHITAAEQTEAHKIMDHHDVKACISKIESMVTCNDSLMDFLTDRNKLLGRMRQERVVLLTQRARLRQTPSHTQRVSPRVQKLQQIRDDHAAYAEKLEGQIRDADADLENYISAISHILWKINLPEEELFEILQPFRNVHVTNLLQCMGVVEMFVDGLICKDRLCDFKQYMSYYPDEWQKIKHNYGQFSKELFNLTE